MYRQQNRLDLYGKSAEPLPPKPVRCTHPCAR
jgi:hypothetical protein